MPIDGYKIRDQYAVHFITFSVIEWIDVFTRKDYANIIVESLNYWITKIKMNYIHKNPLRAGIVRSEWEYMYSSAIDYYCNKAGLIKIDFI